MRSDASRPAWSVEAAQEVLERAGIVVLSVEPIPFGAQIKGEGGIAVSVFETGRVLCQGKESARTKALFETATPAAWVPPADPAVRATAPAKRTQTETVRIATDFASERPEDAGIPPPWITGTGQRT
jgi:hypothetical protein